jgi:hypothetical protein
MTFTEFYNTLPDTSTSQEYKGITKKEHPSWRGWKVKKNERESYCVLFYKMVFFEKFILNQEHQKHQNHQSA